MIILPIFVLTGGSLAGTGLLCTGLAGSSFFHQHASIHAIIKLNNINIFMIIIFC